MQIAKVTKYNALHTVNNNISAVDEMGNRFATTDNSQKVRDGCDPCKKNSKV